MWQEHCKYRNDFNFTSIIKRGFPNANFFIQSHQQHQQNCSLNIYLPQNRAIYYWMSLNKAASITHKSLFNITLETLPCRSLLYVIVNILSSPLSHPHPYTLFLALTPTPIQWQHISSQEKHSGEDVFLKDCLPLASASAGPHPFPNPSSLCSLAGYSL